MDIAMQAWIRDQRPEAIGPALHERFTRSYADGALIRSEDSALSLVDGDLSERWYEICPMWIV